ncbi:MAG: rhomboid family intramembrane serine protease [Bacteroidota bacterium]|nr:rhomboid family intramembrane serine protease [Bacteroidota bacterium]
MRLIDEIRLSFTRSEGLFRILVINVSFFLVIGLMKAVLFLSGSGFGLVNSIIDVLAVKSSLVELMKQPWSLVTYMFVHENFLHILFNMLVFFWTGKIFCEFLGSRKVVAVYVLGGLAGAFVYILSYNLFPAFSQAVEFSKLIGASAGVIAVLVAIATLTPDYTMHLLIFGAVRLKYIAIFLVLLYVISIPDGNAGGNISHLGGAAFGFIYTRSLRAGVDIGNWLERIFDFFLNLFNPSKKLKAIHRNTVVKGRQVDGVPRQEIIDSILDKISRSGYSSLSKEEKEILFKASKHQAKD